VCVADSTCSQTAVNIKYGPARRYCAAFRVRTKLSLSMMHCSTGPRTSGAVASTKIVT
jgi:hypothetical protein